MSGKDAGIFFDQLKDGEISKFRVTFDGKYSDPIRKGKRVEREEVEFRIESWSVRLNPELKVVRTAHLQDTDEGTSELQYPNILELFSSPKTLIWWVDNGKGPLKMLETRIGADNELISTKSDLPTVTVDRVEINVIE